MKAYIFKTLAACFLMAFTACSGSDGGDALPGTDPDTDPGTEIEGDLSLSVSGTVIEANGTDAVTIAVMKGKTDITSSSKVYVVSPSGSTESFQGTSFSTTTEGDYIFYAYYGGEKTEDVTVRAFKDIPALPADSKPDQSTDFVKRVLTIQHTGTWCQNCPYMKKGIEVYLQKNPDNCAVFVASHNGDTMAGDASNAVNSYLTVSSYPSLSVDLNASNMIKGALNDADLQAEQIAARINDAESNGCKTGISVAATEPEGKIVTVNVKVKSANVSNCRVAVWVLEDGIVAAQTGGSSNEVHNNVLRASSSTSAYGDGIQLDSDGTGQNVYRVDVSAVSDLSNCRLVVFTSVPNASNRFVVDNVVTCSLGGQTSFDYE